jgi:hypothetical protein
MGRLTWLRQMLFVYELSFGASCLPAIKSKVLLGWIAPTDFSASRNSGVRTSANGSGGHNGTAL